jgi:Antibiotic biosynthesis monooxygenase
MYARITPMRFDPAREVEVLRLAEEQTLPVTRRLPGFRHYFATGDRATGRGYTITVWDTAEQAEAYRSALGDLVAQFQALGVHFEPAEVQEVLAHA